jgi:hypothetical protein
LMKPESIPHKYAIHHMASKTMAYWMSMCHDGSKVNLAIQLCSILTLYRIII